MARPRRGSGPVLVVDGPTAPVQDLRVRAVLAVLAGHSAAEVALDSHVDVALVHRWVKAFVEAGTAQVTNSPDPVQARRHDRFLAAFAHELRTPLTLAVGWADMLRSALAGTGTEALVVERLQDALGTLSGRTLDVELLAQASLGRLGMVRRHVPVARLVDDVRTDLGGIEVDLAPEVAGTVLYVDPALLGRALRDLWEAADSAPSPRERRLVVAQQGP